MPMSTFMSWLFHRGRTEEGSGEPVIRTSRPLSKEETGKQWLMESSTAEDGPGAGLTHPSGGPLFVGFSTLVQRPNALFEGLTPVHEKAALVTFVGTGITDPNRYQDAAAAFNQLRLMAPPHESALIHWNVVYRPAQVQTNLSHGELVGDSSDVGQRPRKTVRYGHHQVVRHHPLPSPAAHRHPTSCESPRQDVSTLACVDESHPQPGGLK